VARSRCVSRIACAILPSLMLVVPSHAQQANMKPELLITLSVTPATAPQPALKYLLLPELRELNPGNPIQGYFKCYLAVSVRQFQGGARPGARKRRANAALFDMLCDQGSGVALQHVTVADAGSHGAGPGAGLCDATPRGGESKHALGAPEPIDPGASRPPNPDSRPPRAVG
jgi:hypothetical protein